MIEELVVNTEGKTDWKEFNSDEWGGYERVYCLLKLSIT